MKAFFIVATVGSTVAALVAWICAVGYARRAHRGIRSDIAVSRWHRWNTTNLIAFRPECLTADAQADRRRAGRATVAFVVLIVVALLTSLGL